MARHKWSSPYEWLMEEARDWDGKELYSALSSVAEKLDSDALQDLFQSEMDRDGYFRDLDRQVPVIFILDHSGELANITDTLYFCNDTCRNLYYATTTDIDLEVTPHQEGLSRLPASKETFCEYCGGEL